MRRKLGCILAFFGLPLVAKAALNETLSQLAARYGVSTATETTDERLSTSRFAFTDYAVEVTTLDGRSVRESFARFDNQEFTDAEVQKFMEDLGIPGQKWACLCWIAGVKSWIQRDRIFAWKERRLIIQNSLLQRYMSAQKATK